MLLFHFCTVRPIRKISFLDARLSHCLTSFSSKFKMAAYGEKRSEWSGILVKYYLICPNEETKSVHCHSDVNCGRYWVIHIKNVTQWCINCLVTWRSICWSFSTHHHDHHQIKDCEMTRSKIKETEKSILSIILCQVLYCVNHCFSLIPNFVDSDILIINSAIVQLMESFEKLFWVWSETSSVLCTKICEYRSWTWSEWCHSRTENSKNETEMHRLPHYSDM